MFSIAENWKYIPAFACVFCLLSARAEISGRPQLFLRALVILRMGARIFFLWVYVWVYDVGIIISYVLRE